MRFWALLLIQVLVIGCAKHGGGVVDGGGGSLTYATHEQVKSTAIFMWSKLTRLSPDNPLILAQRRLELAQRSPTEEKIYQMLLRINGLGKDIGRRLKHGGADPFQALHAKKIGFAEDAPCAGPWHESNAASVSQLNMNGEVCVSVYALSSTTVDSLRGVLAALLAHEIAHLKGYEEADAELLDSYFKDHIGSLLRTNGEVTRLSTLDRLETLLTHWPYLIRYGWINQTYINQTILVWNEALTWFDAEIMDPYISDDFQTAHPELFDQVKESFRRARTEGLEAHFQDHRYWYGLLKLPGWANAETLSATRETALNAYATLRLLSRYYLGESSADPLIQKNIDDRNKMIANAEAAILRATDPQALHDSSMQVRPGDQRFLTWLLFGEPTLANDFCTEGYSADADNADSRRSEAAESGPRCAFHN